jgi:hypothetical protein
LFRLVVHKPKIQIDSTLKSLDLNDETAVTRMNPITTIPTLILHSIPNLNLWTLAQTFLTEKSIVYLASKASIPNARDTIGKRRQTRRATAVEILELRRRTSANS